MSADYFIFGGFDSRNYNLWLHDVGNGRARILAPPKITVTDRPIGMSGEMIFDQYYAPKEIPLELFCEQGVIEPRDLRNIGTYLSTLGEAELILSYEDYKYHKCVMDNSVELIEYSGGLIFSTLSFKALSAFGFSRFTTSELATSFPQYDQGWMYDSGLMYREDMGDYSFSNITSGQQFAIYHGGNTDYAMPNIRFSGGASTIKIEQYKDSALTDKIAEFNYGAFSGTLNINSELNACFKNGVMDNKTSSGSYMRLYGKTTPTINLTGLIQNISGNNITLASNASALNDYYNNMPIYVLNSTTCQMERRTIVDYVGSTKVVTLDSAFTGASVGSSYSIYNEKDGKNYFKISGTGFSNLNVLFDFRYVYL